MNAPEDAWLARLHADLEKARGRPVPARSLIGFFSALAGAVMGASRAAEDDDGLEDERAARAEQRAARRRRRARRRLARGFALSHSGD